MDNFDKKFNYAIADWLTSNLKIVLSGNKLTIGFLSPIENYIGAPAYFVKIDSVDLSDLINKGN